MGETRQGQEINANILHKLVYEKQITKRQISNNNNNATTPTATIKICIRIALITPRYNHTTKKQKRKLAKNPTKTMDKRTVAHPRQETYRNDKWQQNRLAGRRTTLRYRRNDSKDNKTQTMGLQEKQKEEKGKRSRKPKKLS